MEKKETLKIEKIIAIKTAKYYQELKINYEHLFNNDYSLLATAGILDAQWYIFSEKSIDSRKIIELAKDAVESEEDSLTFFIFELIKLLQSIDYPELGTDDIEISKLEIKNIADEILIKYEKDSEIATEVYKFIDEDFFNKYRLQLEIDSYYNQPFIMNILSFFIVILFCFGFSLLYPY